MHRFSLILCLLAYSCGKAKDAQEGGDQPAGGDALLISEWSGYNSPRNRDGDTKLTEAKVNLTLGKDNTFTITFVETQNAVVKGTYYLGVERIIFDIAESTVSQFGRASTRRVMTYQLLGDSLDIFDDQLELILLKAKPATNPSEPEASSLFGTWSCQQGNNVWQIDLSAEQVFQITVRANNASEPLVFSGNFSSYREKPPQAVIEFHDAQQGDMALTFDAATANKGRVQLRRLAAPAGAPVTFDCAR